MTTRIRAGLLRHRIDFLKVVKTKNSFNESIDSFELVKSTPAGILKNKVVETSVADGIDSIDFKNFIVRYAKWINTDLVIRFDGKEYEIKNIDNPEHRNRELIITTQEV